MIAPFERFYRLYQKTPSERELSSEARLREVDFYSVSSVAEIAASPAFNSSASQA